MLRKSFEMSTETSAILSVFTQMRLSEQMSFDTLSQLVKFPVTSSTPSYQSARNIAERDHGIYIGSNPGNGFFRGTGDDMGDSIGSMGTSIRRKAKRMIKRANLAIRNNLSQERHQKVSELRQRASIIYSTTNAPMPESNRARRKPAPEAKQEPAFQAIRSVK